MLKAMKTGSVLVDVSIDHGGRAESPNLRHTHVPPTPSTESFHYCVAKRQLLIHDHGNHGQSGLASGGSGVAQRQLLWCSTAIGEASPVLLR